MRDRMDRFAILPFSIGCVSQSSVAVSDHTQPKKSHGAEPNPSPKASPKGQSSEGEKTKTSSHGLILALPRRNIPVGLHRLVVRGFRGLSQLFTISREEDEEEEEAKMEIGFPTDVKHVAHVGLDGAATGVAASIAKAGASWGMAGAAPDLFSLPSISFRQFELAMAAQADAPPPAAAAGLRLT